MSANQEAILITRLNMLERAIRSRDWDVVEFQFDRVNSQAEKIAGIRGREYDSRCAEHSMTGPEHDACRR